MPRQGKKIIIFLLCAVVLAVVSWKSGVFVVAEQVGSSPESGVTSSVKTLANQLAAPGFGSTSAGSWGDWGPLWNRVYSSALWTPSDATATVSDVAAGKTFYAGNNRVKQTGQAAVQDPPAPVTPDVGDASRLNTLNKLVKTLSYGSESAGTWGDLGAMWNRIYSASMWIPSDATATSSDVASGKTFYAADNGRTLQTGTYVYTPAPTGGIITYTDADGLNPRSSPAYPGGYTVHTFTSSGVFTAYASMNVDVLAVGGGGSGSNGGNYGGGGGAGEFKTNINYSLSAQQYSVSVGLGGARGAVANGSSSIIGTITAQGGNSGSNITGGSSGNGYSGGTGSNDDPVGGGGGGGSSGNGNYGGSNRYGGDGGAGSSSSIRGSSVFYAGGGGGARGGAGVAGGGNGASDGYDASANTGSGGGGAVNSTGGAGGSGIVVIRYPTPSGSLGILDLGDGGDGMVTVSATKNINLESLGADNDRNGAYADGIAYRVSGIAGGTITTSTDAPGIVPNDKVLLIDLQGTPSDFGSVGNYEVLTVSSVTANSVHLTSAPTKDYDGTGNSYTDQKVIIQRVPQYSNVTVENDGTITAYAWDGLASTPSGNAGFYTGIVAFIANGTITVNTGGMIDASGKGFRNGIGSYGGNNYQGESIIGLGASSQSASAGGGGGAGHLFGPGQTSGGGGGSYATVGNTGGLEGSCTRGEGGAYIYGNQQMDKLYFGGGGGAQYGGTSPYTSGGIVLISANILASEGTIKTDGTGGSGTGNNAAGSGAGGSIKINITSINTGTMSAVGGLGFSYYNNQVGNNTGKGGDGRIAIYYTTSVTGTTNPTAYTQYIGQ